MQYVIGMALNFYGCLKLPSFVCDADCGAVQDGKTSGVIGNCPVSKWEKEIDCNGGRRAASDRMCQGRTAASGAGLNS